MPLTFEPSWMQNGGYAGSPVCAASEPGPGERLAELLAAEMAAAWGRGERPLTEAFLARFPELANDVSAVLRLLYEEICLHEEAGLAIDREAILRRFPQWTSELQPFLECHRLLRPSSAATPFEELRELFGDLRPLAELGRGGLGRVYLATQPALDDRPVVLKVTPCAGREHLALARLQHTHIVPLYWAQDFPAHNRRVLCMPYLGGATLERILAGLCDRPLGHRIGQHLLDALDQTQARAAVEVPRQGPARRYITQATYVQAVCWIGACLADALHYAHERGLVHLDLKPSNILLAADGQPLILDYHLARGPVASGGPAPERFGGTPGYMSPEQQTALAAALRRQPVPVAVDSRSDIYSLGLLLYEALGGSIPLNDRSASAMRNRLAVPSSAPTVLDPGGENALLSRMLRSEPVLPRLDQINPQVTTGLADIIHKCLAHDPAERYLDAASLAGDLRRHRTHQPLRGVANRSLVERWRKWRRRRPYALSLLGMLATVVLAAGLSLANRVQRFRDAKAEAGEALVTGQEQLKRHQYPEAVQALMRGLAAAESLSGRDDDLMQRLNRQLRLARQAEASDRLHLVVERIRLVYGADSLAPEEMRALEARCRALWEARGWVTERADISLEPELEQRVRTDLLDLAILWTELRVRLAPREKTLQAHREALQILAEAETLFGPSLVLCRERQLHARALGLTGEAREAERQASGLVPRTAWEHYALGRIYLRSERPVPAAASTLGLAGSPGETRLLAVVSSLAAKRSAPLALAAIEFEHALDLHPQDLWANFYWGLCTYRLGRYADAVEAFHACVALAPESAECFYNRGLAHAALGRTDRALRDYGRALQLDPHLAAAALNRGMLHYQDGRHAEAAADFQSALANGARPSVVCYNLALVRLAQDDRAAARASLQQALHHDPEHWAARELIEQFGRVP